MKVFISYPQERERDAERWGETLCNAYDVFVCHKQAEDRWPGFKTRSPSYQRSRLAEEIANADIVVVLWDRNYGRAAWCDWELKHALDSDHPRVFVARLDSTPVPSVLLAYSTVIASAEELAHELAQPSPIRTVRPSLDALVLYPAASLLESRFAPRFQARTRGMRELARMAVWLAASLAMQLVLYRAGALTIRDGMPLQMWALLAALSIAMTIVGTLTVSITAAVESGVFALLVVWPILQVCTAIGDIDERIVTIAAATMGTFQLSCMLLLRDRLLGQPLSGAVHTLDRGRPPSWRGHRQAAIGVAIASALLSSGIALLGVSDRLELLTTPGDLPSQLGTLLGTLIGLALAVSSFRRTLGNYRMTAPFRIAMALAVSVGVCGVATGVGYTAGAFIQAHSIPAITARGGAYIGAMTGVLLVAATALPMATGTGWLSVRAERRWGLVGAFIAVAIIAGNVHAFPYAQGAAGRYGWAIALGSLGGLVPIALLRACSTNRGRRVLAAVVRAASSRRSRIYVPVAGAHLAALYALRACSTPSPIIVVLRQPVDIEVVTATAVPAEPTPKIETAQPGLPTKAAPPAIPIKDEPRARTERTRPRPVAATARASRRTDPSAAIATAPQEQPPPATREPATPKSARPDATAHADDPSREHHSEGGDGTDPTAPAEASGGRCTAVAKCLSGGEFGRFAVEAGRRITISARVEQRCSPGHQGWTVDGWKTQSGPEGVAGYQLTNTAMPSALIGTLVGAFSTDGVDARDEAVRLVTREPKVIGSSTVLTSPTAGFLYLIMNDVPGTYADNDGGISATVDICR
jgi:hypothetical protein